jgi:hypothetical protein
VLNKTNARCSSRLSLIDHHQRNATTGLLHCVMTRTKATTSSRFIQPAPSTYKFFVEKASTTHAEELSTQLILAGVKNSGHSYTIHSIVADMSVPCGKKVGSLVRVQMNMYSISYVLKNEMNQSIAYIAYHVPSPLKVLRNPPSRFAELAVHDPNSKSDITDDKYQICDVTEKLNGNNASSTSTSSYFDKICMYSISRHHNLCGVVSIQHDDPSMRVMQSMDPYISSTTGRATLDFRGRGKFASPKNMQLISTSIPTTNFKTSTTTVNQAPPTGITTNTPHICMQMCKWEDDVYHIDFDAPFITHLHAFAFGLAQMDI